MSTAPVKSLRVIASQHDTDACDFMRVLGTTAYYEGCRRGRRQNGSPTSMEVLFRDETVAHLELELVDQPVEALANLAKREDITSGSWYIFSDSNLPRRTGRGSGGAYFLISPRRISRLGRNLPPGRHVALGLNVRRAKGEVPREAIHRRAIGQLLAEVTNDCLFPSSLVKFHRGKDGEDRHYRQISQWFNSETPVNLVSAMCLHASEDRRGIVTNLSREILDLLVRAAKCAFGKFGNITGWTISTFGPRDYKFLGDLGIEQVLLPYMWDAPAETVIADLATNLHLTQQIASLLDNALPFPVTCTEICDGQEYVDMAWLLQAAETRAQAMMPALMANPPAIFNQIPEAKDRLARIRMECILYLLDTLRYGQIAGQNRPATAYLGMEVHGAYWQHGNLFNGPNGEFLPLMWLPSCIKQHYGDWVLNNKSLRGERERLAAELRLRGF